MKIDRLARPNVLGIKPYQPGKPIEEVAREFGLKKIIKLASNESPLGPSVKAQQAVRQAVKKMNFYPEGTGRELRRVIAKQLQLEPENIILGNGSNEIIELVAHAFMNEEEEVITAWPSFLVYFLVADVLNGRITKVPLKYYTYDLDAIVKEIKPETKMIFIANPNNPTGTIVDKEKVARFMQKVPEHVLVVFDEAYVEFANHDLFPDTMEFIREERPVIVLRTFSKIYGLAGLRIGYGIAPKRIVELLNKVRQPFNVNSLAQVAGIAALEDEDYRHRMISLVEEGKRYLCKEFYKLGLFYVPSEANFILVKTGDGQKTFNDLLRQGIIVREMNEYDLPEYFRVTVGTMYQNRKFIKALKNII